MDFVGQTACDSASYKSSWMPAQHAPGQLPGDLAVAQHRGPVDDDVADALGEVVRVFVRGDVADGPRIEDDDVRLLAGGEDAAVREAGARRSERRHLPHRLLQRKQMLVADVVAEDARKRAVRARVRADILHP